MWALIVNMIYQQACRGFIAGMARHHHSWI
jgi:hypothetical protein